MKETMYTTRAKRTATPSLQLAALERTIAIAEFSPDGILQWANKNYLALFRITEDEAIGRIHRSFCPFSFTQSKAYEAFWASLCQGIPYSGFVERIRGDNSSCWLEATYTPVFDHDGHVVQILKIATDISARLQHEKEQQRYLDHLSLAADINDTAVLITDNSSSIVYCNKGFNRMFGWERHEIIGKNPLSLFIYQWNKSELNENNTIIYEELVVGKTRRYWAKIIKKPVFDPDNNWKYTIITFTDISITKLRETLQHQVLDAMSKEFPLSEILDIICNEVELLAPEITASIIEVNAQGQLHPLAAPSLPDAYSASLNGIHIGPYVGSCGTAAWRSRPVIVDDIATDPLWDNYRAAILPLGYVACWSTPIFNNQHQVVGTFAFYFKKARDLELENLHQQIIDACSNLCSLAFEREHTKQRIRQLAFYDELTGLPNRSLLLAKSDQVISSSIRNDDPLAVLYIDLDRFKMINDSYGHFVGDELLSQIAIRLKKNLRSVDIVGRLSGDEFAIILPECSHQQAQLMIEELQIHLAEPMNINNSILTISASIGVAMFPMDGRDIETLLHRADIAMDQAKNSGRSQFCFFSHEMNELLQGHLKIENDLRHALFNHQLHLHYQPQIDLVTGSLYGVEALARWTHPEFGEISPGRFIPIAEECGLITEFGYWVIQESCRQLAEWRTQGINIPSVSVNLSPTSFHCVRLPSTILDILNLHHLKPQELTIELTESVLLDNHPCTMKILHEIHALGVHLSMDDFGTGYSSLSYLRRLPISEFKLDRSFVADLEYDEVAQALSRAILSIGKTLQLTIVAEGVETAEQHQILYQQGYSVAQGYLFSRPLPANALKAWLDEWNISWQNRQMKDV
ncbi:EAL domain-containing protein [Acinetobacter sp. ME22]|uniref:bifunctional diguanylate cyclase/phosphodiesterase n=1 Tax=Acinetobacter sp. ME22 TaxID=2904802 RepID=UPI001EDA7372|nr:GGDEF and EAL domain-containing protein [Acinetobacter sp. ME22]MCG2574134.1 EAL domain-containing protein [Acinetobacter sp. ME22]